MDPKTMELASPLQILPSVEFCCAYGSSLLSNNNDKTSMVDYILGVLDPIQWHAENLKRNRHHYSKWIASLGPKAVTGVADNIGVGVHFNPFVDWKDKMIKYGVVGMQDLARDVLTWDRFYLSGRMQKPVHILVDNWDIRKVNLINLKSATSAALLLLPPEFTEVKKIVQGSFHSFRSIYKPLLQEYASQGLISSHLSTHQESFKQDCGLQASTSLFSSLPWAVQRKMVNKLEHHEPKQSGFVPNEIHICSREDAANCIRRVLRRKVMVASARQAASGFLATGGVNAARYLAKKMSKAWASRTVL